MTADELRERTKQFALRIIKLAASLPAGRLGDVVGKQVLKAGTSVGANYREALRASSRRHFITTMEIALREADECVYWLELVSDAAIIKPERLNPLIDEAKQLVAILAASVRTAKQPFADKSEI